MRLFRCFFALLISLLLCSCSAYQKKTSEDILHRLMTGAGELPDGEIYVSGAEEGSEEYMPPFLREAMYGEGHSEYFSLIEDYSIYLSSFAEPYEIAVFKCYSKSDGIRIERMCRARADILEVALNKTKFSELCKGIRVIRKDHFVIFIMTESSNEVARLAKRLV